MGSPKLHRRVVRAVGLLVGVVVMAPDAADAVTFTPPLAQGGQQVASSSFGADPHVAIVWPQVSAGTAITVKATDDAGPNGTWELTLGFGDSAPSGIAGACSTIGGPFTTISCTVPDTVLHAGIEVWTGDDTDTVTVSPLSDPAAPVAAFLGGGAGTQQFRGGPADDFVSTAERDDAPGGASYLYGGAGLDAFTGSPNAYDIVSYDDGRPAVNAVSATFNCTADDGNPAYDEGSENVGCSAGGVDGLEGSAGDDTLVGDDGSGAFFGRDGNDVIDAGGATDQLFGGDGNDTLTGGPGHDEVHGDQTFGGGPSGAGSDVILLRDGNFDELQDCGPGTDTAQLDEVAIDPDYPGAADCESVTHAALGGGSGGGGGGSGGGGSGGGGGAPIDTTSTLRMPALEPERLSTKQRWRFHAVGDFDRALDASAINADVSVRRVPLTRVPSTFREHVEDGDIVSQTPRPGTALSSDLTPPHPKVALTVYEQALDYKGKRCPYGDRAKFRDLTDAIEGHELGGATRWLRERGCRPVVVKEFRAKGVSDSRVYTASLYDRRGKSGRALGVSLVVQRPRLADFAINITERPKDERDAHPAARKEIGIGDDGYLTAGLAPAVVHLDLAEGRTGRFVRDLEVQVIRQDGKVLASTRTSRSGGLTFTFPVDFTGDVDILARMAPASAGGLEALESWTTLQVVDRKRRPFYTKSGRYFTFRGDRYVESRTPVEERAQAALEADAARMLLVAQQLAGKSTAFAQAAAILADTSKGPAERMQDAYTSTGLLPGSLVAGSNPDGRTTAATVGADPNAVRVSAAGVATRATITAAMLPKTGDVDVASLVRNGYQPLIGLDGATLIGQDGATLIGQDGATLIGNDSNSLISSARNGLVNLLGGPLISDKSGGVISDNGLGVISDNGAGVLPPSAAGLIDPASGRLIGNDSNSLIQLTR